MEKEIVIIALGAVAVVAFIWSMARPSKSSPRGCAPERGASSDHIVY